jgi:hypothetical protein
VKIERQLAPRSLSAEQVADVASKLAPFAGYKVQLWACPPDEEVVRIANAIVAALRSARWEAPLVLARPMSTAPRGMELDVAPDASDVERHAAAALAEALAAEGLAVVGPTVKPLAAPMVMMTGPSAATAATEKTNLRLMIGTK